MAKKSEGNYASSALNKEICFRSLSDAKQMNNKIPSMWTLKIIQFIRYQSTWTGPRGLIFKLALLYFRNVFDNVTWKYFVRIN